MKTSLDHLSRSKQHKLRALADLIRTETEAEMIILFGSFARGDFVEDPVGGYFSDFDVLVVVKSRSQVDKHEVWSRVEQLAARLAEPTELTLIVHDIKDVNRQLEAGQFFFSDIKREGIMLYDSGERVLAEAKEKTAQGRYDFARESYARWFESSERFLGLYEHALTKAWHNEAAFNLHQATERLYHTVLLVFTAHKPKTHNIETLGKRASDLCVDLRNVLPHTTPEDKRLFLLLKHAYVDARYSSKYAITNDELKTIASWVDELRQRVERVCSEHLARLALAADV